MKLKLQFFCALFVAAAFELYKKAAGIKQALDTVNKVSHPKAAERLKHCQNCPVFYKPLQTCGTPLTKELRDMGCRCFMPVKIHTRTTCWLRDKTDGSMGWPEELNDFPLKK